MSRFGVFKIAGVEYDLDDLTLDEVEHIEDLCAGVPFSELNYGSAKTMKAITFVLMRRSNPDMEYSDVGSVRVLDFMPADEELPALPPDEEGVTESQSSESPPADTGARLSVASTPG